MSTTKVEIDQLAESVTCIKPYRWWLCDHAKPKPLWLEYMETVLWALLGSVLLRLLLISAYTILSGSMEGALYKGDYIFVNKVAYERWWSDGPQIGDIIVFKSLENLNENLIKRVVALPGQTVDVRDKIVYVDSVRVDKPVNAKNIDSRVLLGEQSFRDNFGPYTVPADRYFVMGDNRDNSRDSRFWGSVPMDHIRGKAMLVYWSWRPDQDSPGWQFPYMIDPVQWASWVIYNFYLHVRWGRLGNAL